MLPLLFISFPIYLLEGYLAEELGVAWSNAAIGVMLADLTVLQAKKHKIAVNYNPLKLLDDMKKMKLLYQLNGTTAQNYSSSQKKMMLVRSRVTCPSLFQRF